MDPKVEEIIELLNSNGLSILIIDEDMFVVNTFIPCDTNINKTRIVGMNIKTLINKSSMGELMTVSSQTALLQKINELPMSSREYSSHFPWKIYSAR
tara:strand:+ start:994 stop:1284 length:291 start_codon:yes stop_codon:yes gene_type:complete